MVSTAIVLIVCTQKNSFIRNSYLEMNSQRQMTNDLEVSLAENLIPHKKQVTDPAVSCHKYLLCYHISINWCKSQAKMEITMIRTFKYRFKLANDIVHEKHGQQRVAGENYTNKESEN